MPEVDPFATQLVALVRAMPDETILALVRAHLGAPGALPPAAAIGRAPKSPRAPRKTTRRPAATRGSRPQKQRRQGALRANRADLVGAVEKLVNASKGLSLANVATATRVSKNRAKAALRQLKAAGRIASGGDRKFTRYAADRKTAEAASLKARAGGA